MRFVCEVRALPGHIIPLGDLGGDLVPIQQASRSGQALFPEWGVIAPLLPASEALRVSQQAKFITDPPRRLVRIVSPDTVGWLCMLVDDIEGGLPRLKVHIAFKDFGLAQAD